MAQKPMGRPKFRGPTQKVTMQLSTDLWDALGGLSEQEPGRSRTLVLERILRAHPDIQAQLGRKEA